MVKTTCILILLIFGTCLISSGQADSVVCQFKVDSITGQRIYTAVDKMPEPEGGMVVLYHKLGSELELKNFPKDEAITSMTVVSFVVTETGEIINKKVKKEAFKGTDVVDQMFVAIEAMRWIPGSCQGRKVKVQYMLPLRICLRY